MNRVLSNAVQESARQFDQLGDAAREALEDVDFDDALREITDGVDDAGRVITRELGDAADEAARLVEDAFEGMDTRIADELDVSDEFGSIADDLRTEARNLTRQIESEFTNLDFGDAFEGFDDGVESTRRLAEASENAARLIEEAFDGIGDRITDDLDVTDEFARVTDGLRADARVLAVELAAEFAGASDRIQTELSGLGGAEIGDALLREASVLSDRLVDEFDGVGNEIAAQLDFDDEFARIVDRIESDAAGVAADLESEFSQAADGIESELDGIDASGLSSLIRDAATTAGRVVGEFAGAGRRIASEISTGAEFASSIVADASRAASRVVSEFDGVGEKIGKEITDGITGALGKLPKLVAGIGLGAGAALTVGFVNAVNREGITDRLAGSLGLTPEEATELGAITGSLYANAYGESFENVAAVVRDAFTVDIPLDQLELVTSRAFTLESAFGGAAEEYLTLTAQLRNQGVIDDVTEGLDLITVSFQELPSTLQEPLTEALREYAIFADQLGLSAEETFSLFVAAAQRGEFELDKVGDALKEFGIRATDLSATSGEAFEAIGLDMTEMADALLAGGEQGAEAFTMIVEGLLAIPSDSERAAAAIALFGTPLEDLSVNEIPAFLESLLGIEGGFDNVTGSVDRLDKTINENFGTSFESFKRSAENAFTAIADSIIGPALEEIQPHLDRFAEWMREEGPDAADKVREAVTPVIESLGDALRDIDWEGVLTTIGDALADIDFEAIGTALVEFDWVGLGEDIASVAESIVAVVDAAAELFSLFDDLQLSTPFDIGAQAGAGGGLGGGLGVGGGAGTAIHDFFADLIGDIADTDDAMGDLRDSFEDDWDEIVRVTEASAGAIVEASAGIATAFSEDWDEIKEVTSEVASGIADAFEEDFEELEGWIGDIATAFSEDWEEIKTVAAEVGGGIADAFVEDFEEIEGWIGDIATAFEEDWGELTGFAEEVAGGIADAFAEDFEELETGIGDVAGFLEDRFDEAAEFITDLYGDAEELFAGILNYDYSGLFSGVNDAINDARTDLGETLGEILEDVDNWATDKRARLSEGLDGLKTIASDKWNETRDAISTELGNIKSDVATKYEEIRVEIDAAYDEIVSDTLGFFTDIGQQFLDGGNTIIGLVTSTVENSLNTYNTLWTMGSEIITGFKDDAAALFEELQLGIQDKITQAKDWVLGELRKIRNTGSVIATEAQGLIEGPFEAVRETLSGLFDGIDLGTPSTGGVLGALDTIIGKIDGLIGKIRELAGLTEETVRLSGVAANLRIQQSRSTGSLDPTRSTGGFREPNSGASTGGRTGIFGEGGLATFPSIVAEDFKPEIVLPLTKRDRMIAVLSGYASEIVGAAGGVDAAAAALFGGAVSSAGGEAFQVNRGDIVPPPSPQGVPFTGRTNPTGRTRGSDTALARTADRVTHNHFYGVEAGTVAKQMRDNDRSVIQGLRVRP